jgi:hypothetical protein
VPLPALVRIKVTVQQVELPLELDERVGQAKARENNQSQYERTQPNEGRSSGRPLAQLDGCEYGQSDAYCGCQAVEVSKPTA